MGISTTSQPRAKRKLDRTQPQEKGRHRSCAAPNGACAECQSKTTGSRPWLKLYRRSAAKMANLQRRDKVSYIKPHRKSISCIEASRDNCEKMLRAFNDAGLVTAELTTADEVLDNPHPKGSL